MMVVVACVLFCALGIAVEFVEKSNALSICVPMLLRLQNR